MPKFFLDVTEPSTYRNSSWGNAALYTVHELIPGTYELTHPNVSPCAPADTGQLAVNLPCKLMHRSYNGVDQRNYAPGEEGTVYMSWYTFEAKDGQTAGPASEPIGTFRVVEDEG